MQAPNNYPNQSWPIQFNQHPDSKVHGTNMGPIWGRQDPVGPHVSPMNFAFWACLRHQVQIVIIVQHMCPFGNEETQAANSLLHTLRDVIVDKKYLQHQRNSWYIKTAVVVDNITLRTI